MKKIWLILLIISISQVDSAFAEVKWKVVPGRSSVEFKVKHFILSNIKGKFKKYEGEVVTKNLKDLTGAKVKASIPISSIYTGNKDRDNHLKTSDFFDISKHPEMKFESTSVTKVSANTYIMKGKISMRGVERPIEFKVKHLKKKFMDGGKVCCDFIATASLNRYNFGLKWNELTEAGGMVVDELVNIKLTISLAAQV